MNAITQIAVPKFTPPKDDNDRRATEAKGRQLLVDDFIQRLGVVWKSIPRQPRQTLARNSGFDFMAAKKLGDKEWDEMQSFEHNVLGHGVLRVFQLSDFMREVLT